MFDIPTLRELQAMSLEEKEEYALRTIETVYSLFKGKVYVAFSGGKDSTVLLHLVRRLHPEVEGVFCDTGLEYPENREFVKTTENIVWIKPEKTFRTILEEFGYPVISKEQAQYIEDVRIRNDKQLTERRLGGGRFSISERWKFLIDAPFKISSQCCDFLKKNPAQKYSRETGKIAFVGTMAEDSRLRELIFLKHGCNTFGERKGSSKPLSIWTRKDIWDYIKKYNLSYSKVYDLGYENTGCMFCMFGLQLEKSPNRFERMRETHPKHYKYCMENLGLKEVLEFMDEGIRIQKFGHNHPIPENHKHCNACGQILPLEKFGPRNNRPMGVQPICRSCYNRRKSIARKKKREKNA